jgi:hypothetical protein
MTFGAVLRKFVVPAAAVAGMVVAAAPAVAAPAPALNHCVGNIVTYVQKCYATEAEALRLGTGERAPAVNLVTLYDGFNRGPASFTITGPRACTATSGDRDYSHPDMRRFGGNWNDRPSSVDTYNQCDIWFSSEIEYIGECGNRWIDEQMDLRRDSCNNRASSYDLS